MEKIRARIPWEFFHDLLPFNAEVLSGNAMLVRACGAQSGDGSILRSKGYLIFGNGMATLLPQTKIPGRVDSGGYVAEFVRRSDPRGVEYWEVQSVPDQTPDALDWYLNVSSFALGPSMGGHVRRLIEVEGDPGQFIYLSCPS